MQIEHDLGLPDFENAMQAEEFAAKLVMIFRCVTSCAAPVWLVYSMAGMRWASRRVDGGWCHYYISDVAI